MGVFIERDRTTGSNQRGRGGGVLAAEPAQPREHCSPAFYAIVAANRLEIRTPAGRGCCFIANDIRWDWTAAWRAWTHTEKRLRQQEYEQPSEHGVVSAVPGPGHRHLSMGGWRGIAEYGPACGAVRAGWCVFFYAGRGGPATGPLQFTVGHPRISNYFRGFCPVRRPQPSSRPWCGFASDQTNIGLPGLILGVPWSPPRLAGALMISRFRLQQFSSR